MEDSKTKAMPAVLLEAPLRHREAAVYDLLASLPRDRLAHIHRTIAPMLLTDIVGLLPDELALRVFQHLCWQDLLTSSIVSRRWYTLASDDLLWKSLCDEQGWIWRKTARRHVPDPVLELNSDDDEGMGDEEDHDELHNSHRTSMPIPLHLSIPTPPNSRRHSAPSTLPITPGPLAPNYKLLYKTHVRLRNRMLQASYDLTVLPPRTEGHTSTIYCLQLYTYPQTGEQVLFTGSKDHTICEWDLGSRSVRRILAGTHTSSILSVCAHGDFVASGGSDCIVALWALASGTIVGKREDHLDSVLCVRFDEIRLVSCSKDRTVRTYKLPNLTPEHVLVGHRAAVNAVSISGEHIVSASGDRSIRLWNAQTGELLHTLENHHTRGIASIDISLPYVLTGSSDKHIRLIDLNTTVGWSTWPDIETVFPSRPAPASARVPAAGPGTPALATTLSTCDMCGADRRTPPPSQIRGTPSARVTHGDLVRSVAMGGEFVVSASYDRSIRLWDRASGALIANLVGGHTGRVFSVDFDCTKIVSCGEDQKICIWDFSRGINTSILTL